MFGSLLGKLGRGQRDDRKIAAVEMLLRRAELYDAAGGKRMTTKHYVVQTSNPSIATTEIVVDEITRKGFETIWLATLEPYTDRFHQTHTLKASLFPGYIFVAFDTTDHGWKAIRQCRNVRDILGPPERPTALPAGCVDSLRARFSAGEFKVKTPDPLKVGDRIVVDVGPDRNTIGTVKLSRGDRVKVLYEFLGQQEGWIGADRVRRAAE